MQKTLAVLSLVALTAAVPAARGLQLSDIHRFVAISGVQISPDGRSIAYIRAVPDFAGDKWRRTLRVVGTIPRDVTQAMESLDSPRWSPRGDRLAYIANDAKKTGQVFAVSPGGGAAQQITHSATDVEQFAWSPDGTRIAYVASDPEQKGVWSVGDDAYTTQTQPQPSHIWLVNSDGTRTRRLTGGSWSVLETAAPFVGGPSDPSWSPDGAHIAFIMQSNAAVSDADRTSAAIVDVRSGALHKVTGRTQYEYQSAYSPDSNVVAYLYPHGPGPVSVLDVFRGMHDATAHFDRDVVSFQSLRGGRMLLMAPQSARTMLFRLNGAADKPVPVSTNGLDVSEFSATPDGSAIAFIGSASGSPPEVYVSRAAGVRAVSNENAALRALQYGRSVDFTWRAADGQRNDGVLTYPAGYVAGKKYPLVLRIHGGPEASSTLAYSELRQMFAARGYIVFEPNYRGSDDLGSAHEHAIYKDPGVGPGQDVIAGVRALEKLGMVDTSREAVTGHSYGGYMTTWMIDHWHAWRCAVVGDGMVNWFDEYNFSGTGNLAWTRDSLGGSPWTGNNAALYRSGSPITYATEITTPTRIISGTADETVPITESYELYHALHDRGVPVSFIAFPGMHHGPSKPSHIEAYDRVTLEWVDRYMR